ncbi:MAG TPA: pirin family protein [Methanospirillum sp.]|nr:pirin family protein [Methanospirillum sp.]
METLRGIREVFHARPTREGAGVLLHRAFGYSQVPRLDPFLMLDDFRGDRPDDYLAGFPWHPHRGIETVTYMLDGEVDHGDSMGNAGVIGPGDVQWMTAGSGIIHQEMPRPVDGKMGGFQLWVNLPASAKMMNPRYQEVKASTIPVVRLSPDVHVRVIAGTAGEITGPVQGIVAEPLYLDITVSPGARFIYPVSGDHTVIVYVFSGSGLFSSGVTQYGNRTALLFDDGDEISAVAGDAGLRFLMIAGKPIKEPVAWGGPIVMNTEGELQQAFEEYRAGTFIKKDGK